MSAVFRFQPSELFEELPGPGYYPGSIVSARCCRSARGNPMLQVNSRLDEMAESYCKVADYFVLEGVSSQGAATARRRLVELCRAAGLDPYTGEVAVDELVGVQLQVKVAHDQYGRQPRLKVVGYREQRCGQLVSPD
jgi:hypothetical protein